MTVLQLAHSPKPAREINPPAAPAPARDTPFQTIDRSVHATIAQFTGGLAPAALAGAYLDWAVHLAVSPGKRVELAGRAATGALQHTVFAARALLGSGRV